MSIRIFGLIFVWAIFKYQFSDQLFSCYNFVHFLVNILSEASLQCPFCCEFFSCCIFFSFSSEQLNKKNQTQMMYVTLSVILVSKNIRLEIYQIFEYQKTLFV